MSEKVGVAVKKPESKAKDSALAKTKAGFSPSVDINSPVEQILHLQRTIGNQAVTRLIRSGVIQAKLTIGQPGDIYEQEADRVADRVMRMKEPQGALGNGHLSLVQRQSGCPGCEEEEKLHRKDFGGSNYKIPLDSEIESRINALKGGGQPLSAATRSLFEPRFGADFSHVRVHTDTGAAQTAQSINARAFTTGKDIVFGSGEYSPGTSSGKHLLAHELTHVIQQNKSEPGGDQIQRFQLPISGFLGLPDIYVEPIPHTHPLQPCVNQDVSHIGVVAKRKTPVSTGGGKIIFDLHIGFYKDAITKRICFVMFESKSNFCLKLCFPNWNDLKAAWEKIRDAIADALKYFFAALGIAVAAWVLYLIADAIAAALLVLVVV